MCAQCGGRVISRADWRLQQPHERAIFALVELAPHDVALVLGPREGDVEKAHPLGKLLVLGAGGGLGVLRRAEVEDGVVFVVVKERVLASAEVGFGPQERAEDDGPFEPFAFVDGEDFHRVVVALQPEFFVVARAGFAHLLGEPAEQSARPELELLRGGMQQLGEVQEIRETALALRLGEDSRAKLLRVNQLAEHLDEPTFAPAEVVVVEARQHRLPFVRLRAQAVEPPGVVAENARGKCGADARFPRGRGQRGGDDEQLARFVGGEDV